jgi:MFS family permease
MALKHEVSVEKTTTSPSYEYDSRLIIILGFLTLFTITAASLLHANEPEFILARFSGLTELEYSYFDSVLYLAYLIIGILTYLFSDMLGKRKLFILTGSVGSAIFYFLMTYTSIYSILLIFRFIQGSFTVMVWQILMTLVLDYSDVTARGKNMGIYGMFLALAMGLGPMVGGMIASIDVFAPYWAAAILSLFVFILAVFVIKEPITIKKRISLKQSINAAREYPKVIVPCLFNFIDRLHMGFIITALPLFLLEVLGLSESLRGISLGLFALPFIILQYPMGKISDKYGRYKQLIIGSIIYGVILASLGFFGSFGFINLVILLMLLGVFSGFTSPAAMALVGDSVGKEETAMAMGFFNFFGNIGMVIGPVLFGTLIAFTDFTITFLVAGLIELISLAINLSIIRFIFKE